MAFTPNIHNALGYYLGLRARSEYEVRTYLKRKSEKYKLTPESIDSLVEKYRELGFINDPNFAESMAHSIVANKGKGRRFLQAKLAQAGIDKEVITQTVQELDPEEVKQAMEKRLARYTQKWAELDKRTRFAKAYQALLASGFSSSEIRPFLDDWGKLE